MKYKSKNNNLITNLENNIVHNYDINIFNSAYIYICEYEYAKQANMI